MAKVVEFTNSSAVAKISYDGQNRQVGVAFNYKPDNFYVFECKDVDEFEEKVNETVTSNQSLGKFISLSRKDGTLVSV